MLLSPHRLNANIPRADDYGIARMRTEQPGSRPPESRLVADLMVDPKPGDPHPSMLSPAKPYAGKSQLSSVQLHDNQVADAPFRGVFAGRRAKSTVFEDFEGFDAAASWGPAAPM